MSTENRTHTTMSDRASSTDHSAETALSVLYVEDSDIVRESTLLLMENYFDRVDTACDGEEGLSRYQHYYQEHGRHYDIVFTDLKMPKMDGLLLSKSILRTSPEQNIVVISAHDESEYLLELINLGISQFLLKPINTDQFDSVVSRLNAAIQNEKMLQDKQEELVRMNQTLIRAKQEAEQASIAKSHFLANMSHEIRTPLNAINGFIHLLRENETDTEKRNYLDIVHESSHALLLIISDILDLSKIESGKMELIPVDFSPHKSLVNVGKLFQAKAIQKGIELDVFCEEEMPTHLHADILRIKQIVFNLLSNAIKFTPDGGNASCTLSYHDGQLVVKVRDSGIGIPPDKIHQIFEPFSQVDDSTSRAFGGTGLGLSISTQLAYMLGGTLTVESTPGSGSLFVLSLPAPPATGSRTRDDHIPARPARPDLSPSPHILIVEDNEANAMFVTIALKKFGMTCDTAFHGLEAIEKYKSGHYDLILMDENMPRLSGIEATQAILKYEQHSGLPHTPVIALTANAVSGDRERFLAAGMDGYLSKPIDPQTLVDTILSFVSRTETPA